MKILVICLMLLSMVVISGCVPEGAEPTTPSAISNPDPNPGAHLVPSGTIGFYEIPDMVSPSGRNVEIKLTFTNHDSAARVIRDFPPEIKVESRNLSSTNNVIRTFTAGEEQLELQPGEAREYVLNWDQKNDFGQQVPYGWYEIRVNIHSREITDTRSMQGSEAHAARILVLPPGGVVENNIELAQSQSADGITVNLEKLEMRTTGAALYINLIPEDYNREQELRWSTGNEAQYKVDGEDWKPAHKAEFGTLVLEDGVRYIWNLDPVPQGSRKLALRLTKLGGTEGLWEFEIPLESGLPFKASIGIFNNQENFLPGDEVMYSISITNLSFGIITIDPYGPAMQIRSVDRNEVVYSSPAGNRTQDIVTEYPMSWYRTKGVWDQKDNNGQQVPPGWYEISYEYVIIEQSTGERFTADLKTRLQIVPPDSAMNKDLEINQSVTAEGITVTLESLELNAVKGTVSVFTVPPGYTPPQEHPMEEPVSQMFESLLAKSIAEYCVDGGIARQPLNIRMKSNDSGVRLIWDIGPIPIDAQEFIFTVRQLGDWTGLWEFKVKLN
ncbi:MAG: hypothetical protein PHU23_09365 [Dehalococcoidales bacterium]|nr:hypothetical protein [Dehalococcoidales bacterium]